jgi:hypothetical protein
MSDRMSRYFSVTLLLLCSICVHAQTTSTLTGTITDSSGNPLNGTLTMRLPVPAQYTPTNKAVAPTPVTYNVLNGVIQGGTILPLYDVAALQPSNLYYIARAYDLTGALQFYGNFVVTGASFNLGAATPTSITTSNISYLIPASLSGNNTWTGINTWTNSSIFNGPVTFNGLINGGQIGSTFQIANQNPTGTTLDTLTKFVGAPTTAQIAAVADSTPVVLGKVLSTNVGAGTYNVELFGLNPGAPALGITIAGAGATGSATIQQSGIAPCVFDGSTIAGDTFIASGSVAGDCHDTGFAFNQGAVLGELSSLSFFSLAGTDTLFGWAGDHMVYATLNNVTTARLPLTKSFFNVASSTTVFSTLLSFNVSAASPLTSYHLHCDITSRASAVGAGPKFQVTATTVTLSPLFLLVDGGTNATAYANATVSGTGTPNTALSTLGATGTDFPVRADVFFTASGSDGQINLQMAASAAGTLTFDAGNCTLF